MDFKDLIPLLIFIGIPVLKSIKEKKEFNKTNKTKKVSVNRDIKQAKNDINNKKVTNIELKENDKKSINNLNKELNNDYKFDKENKIESKVQKKGKETIKDEIKKNEIRDNNNFDLSFTKEELIKAVVMKEILSEPKALNKDKLDI
ncbi:MAG: hypothetical protein FH753_05250 [Firmicutes bacterium]|nr:hypothetical protein [Bacillota bacterium]